MINSKCAQGWGMDLVIAVSIFTIGLVAFYIYSLNSPEEAKENLEILSYNGKILASTLLSEGYPVDWDTNNVVKIGILTNNKINETKLKYFYYLTTTESDYANTKKLLDMSYDYYFFLDQNIVIDGIEIDGIGKPGVNRNSGFEDAKNLIKTTRYAIYGNKPVAVYIYTWER